MSVASGARTGTGENCGCDRDRSCGLGGGLAYKKFKTYLHEKQLRKERKERRRRAASTSEQEDRKSVPFGTELLQSLGNGHANEREFRSRRRKIDRTLVSRTCGRRSEIDITQRRRLTHTAERSGTSETDGKAARVAVEFRTEIPSNGHGLYLRVSYFCSRFAACRAEAAKAGAKRSTERHGAPALPTLPGAQTATASRD